MEKNMFQSKQQRNIPAAEVFKPGLLNPVVSIIARVRLILVLAVVGAAGVAMGSTGWITESRLVQDVAARQLDEVTQLRQQNDLLLARLSEVEAKLEGELIALQRNPAAETTQIKFMDPMKAFRAKVRLALAAELKKLDQHGAEIHQLKQDIGKRLTKASFDNHTHSFSTVKTGYMTKAVFDNCIGCLLHVTAPHNVGKSWKKVTSKPE